MGRLPHLERRGHPAGCCRCGGGWSPGSVPARPTGDFRRRGIHPDGPDRGMIPPVAGLARPATGRLLRFPRRTTPSARWWYGRHPRRPTLLGHPGDSRISIPHNWASPPGGCMRKARAGRERVHGRIPGRPSDRKGTAALRRHRRPEDKTPRRRQRGAPPGGTVRRRICASKTASSVRFPFHRFLHHAGQRGESPPLDPLVAYLRDDLRGSVPPLDEGGDDHRGVLRIAYTVSQRPERF